MKTTPHQRLTVGRRAPFRVCLGPILGLLVALAGFSQPATAPDRWNVLPVPVLVDLPNTMPGTPTLTKSLGEAAEFLTRWKEPGTRAAWKARRPEVELAFRRAIGLERYPERTPLNARVTGTSSFGDYAVERLVFESRPGFLVTANLYRPTGQGGPVRRPAVLSPIGHFLTPGKTAPEVQSRCIQLARLGFIVLAYDAIGQGERMTPGNIHHDAGYALLPLGETIAGWMVWESMRALDYLVTRPDVDPERLGITGNSGGGLNSLFTGALDPRLRAVVIVGFTFEFGNWLKYGGAHCTCTHLPGLFRGSEWFEIAGLIEPRAAMMIQGEEDRIFPISGARRAGAGVERIYQLAGHPGRARFVSLPGLPHAYSRPFRESMYGWMRLHLQGRGRGEPIPEGVIETLPENDPRLLCDPERRFMPGVPTVVDLARRAALQHLTRLPDLPSAASRESLLRWARDRVAAPEGRPHFLSPRVHGTLGATEGAAEKISFNTEDGERLPGLLWHPAGEAKGNGQTLLIADDRGKGEVAISGLVQPLRAAGYAILAVDLRGRGETLGRYGPGYDTNFRLVANQVLAGDPLAGRRAFDLARTLDYLASRPDVGSNRVTLVGLGADALPAVLAAATDPRVHRLVIARYLHSFLSQMRARTSPPRERLGEAWNDPQLQGGVRTPEYDVDFGAVIPSVLAVADLPELLTLVAPRPVLFCDARDTAAPDAGVLLSRFRAIHEGSSLQTLRYLPAHPLDSTLLLEWLQEGGSR